MQLDLRSFAKTTRGLLLIGLAIREGRRESLCPVFPPKTTVRAGGRLPWFSHSSRNRSLGRQWNGGSPRPKVLDVLSVRNHYFGHLGDVRRNGRGPYLRVSSIGRRCKGLRSYRARNPAQVASSHLSSILRVPRARRTKAWRGNFSRARAGTDRAHISPRGVGLRRRHRDDRVREPRWRVRHDIQSPPTGSCPTSDLVST